MRVLLADDHALIRDGLALLLQQLEPAVTVIQAGNGCEALESFDLHNGCDMALIDLAMPDMDGFDLLAELSGRDSSCRLVTISATDEPTAIRRARANGALGFIHKSWSSDRMIEALRKLRAGQAVWPPGLAGNDTPAELTTRQQEILLQVAGGAANRQIAEQLFITEHTVKYHLATLFDLLGAQNRTECVGKARALGLIA